MLLVWNYLIITMYFFNKVDDPASFTVYRYQYLELVAGGLTLSIAGWLADVRIGRYKMIRFSMWAMWITYTLATACDVTANLVTSYAITYITEALLILATMGLALFQANILQFGIDQLPDASTDEIVSFIIWYVWTGYASGFVAQVVFDCLPKDYEMLKMIVMCVYLSAALCLLLLFNNLLIKEPVTQNPFKLVYQIIRFAIKTKHPRYRSAFTYCEDELPSRIDFGKSKYGGPFTTEQVEDVKTFLRLLAIIAIISILFGQVTSFSLMLKLFDMFDNDSKSLQRCYLRGGILDIAHYSWGFVLPLYEYFCYPLFQRFLVVIKSQWMILIGIVFLIFNVLSLMIIEIQARHNYLKLDANLTIQCAGHGILSASLDYRWMVIPYVFHSMSIAIYAIGVIQFIVAQSPYSMRGLIMGAAYGLSFLSVALSLTISVPFTHNLSIWETAIISCGFWHSLMILTIEGTAGILLALMLKKYKRRKREDVLPSEHIFAERYYEKDC